MSFLGGVMRWLVRLIVAGIVIFASLVLLGRFLPMPSTLMLGRWATGREVTRVWQPIEAMSPALVFGRRSLRKISASASTAASIL